MVNPKAVSDDAKLIADIYYDSGLSKDIFNKIYLDTLKRYLSKINSDDQNIILNSVRRSLRKRRSFYFPNGVCAEDVHSNKDVWTFVVFLAGLIIPTQTKDVKYILNKILDKKVLAWLKEKDAETVLYAICDAESNDRNVQTIRRFYGLERTNDIVGVESNTSHSENSNYIPINTPDKLTNKEVGKLFIQWMLKYATNENEVVFIEGGYYLVKSPLAFIEFSKIDKHAWKSVQKGVFKLGLHEANEDNGTPFHKVKGVNMMKYDVGIKEALYNHVDYPNQKHTSHYHQ